MDKEKLKTDKKLELMEEICEIADEFTLDYVKWLRKTSQEIADIICHRKQLQSNLHWAGLSAKMNF